MGNTPKKRTSRTRRKSDDLSLGVQVASGEPGVSPTAFLAVVEAIDADGEKRFQIVESDGLNAKRREALLEHLTGGNA